MKNKKLFQKIVFITLIVLVLFASVAPVIFSQTQGTPKQEKLLNGLKVLMWSDAKADKVSLKLRIHSGSAFDPQGREGVMQLLADSLFPNEAAREFFTEDLGGSLEIVTNYDFIQINTSSKPEEYLSMLETVASSVSNPQIDKETTIKIRDAHLAKVAAMEADPAYAADRAVAKTLFGTFPYGRPQFGDAASLKKIDFADLLDAKGRFLTADNATLIISGNFDRALAFKGIRRYFGSWLKSDKRVPTTFRQPDEPPTGILTLKSPKPEMAEIRFAMRGTARNEKDMAASMVFSAILENRLKARVPAVFTDSVSVWNEAHALPGIISARFTAVKNMVGDANGKIDAGELVGKAIADPITQVEFQTAKNLAQADWLKKDASSFWLDADTFKIANMNADIKMIENVTFSDVNKYAEKARTLPLASVLVNTPVK